MSEKNIEVEVRSFITKEQYSKILDFFKENAKLTKEDSQETHYFDCEQDLRIQKNNSGAKLWLKKGKMHDTTREEIEIKTKGEDFDKLREIFEAVGFKVGVKWFRDRKQFDFNGIKACLDYTKGYGYILELEKMSSENEKEKALEELKLKFKELGIEITPKEKFDEQFDYYKKNWRSLV